MKVLNIYLRRCISIFGFLVFSIWFISCSSKEVAVPEPLISKIPSGRLGDEIVIDGENFEKGRLQVFFDNEESYVNYVTDKKIKVFIPRGIKRFNPTLTIVDLEKNSNIIEQTFELVTPNISGFDKTEVTFQEQLVIYGENFDTHKDFVSIKINGEKASVINANYEEITVRVPSHVIDKNLIVTVVAQRQEVQSSAPLILKKPEIHSTSEKFNPGGSFEISGDNFHPDAGYGKVFINGIQASISASSKNMIRIYTPKGPYEEFYANELKYELAGYSVTYDLNMEIIGNILLVDENPGDYASKTVVNNTEAYAYFPVDNIANGNRFALYKFTKIEQKWSKVSGIDIEGYLNEITTDNKGGMFVYFSDSSDEGKRKLIKINLNSLEVKEYSIPFEEDYYTINFLYFKGHLYAQKVKSFDGGSYSTEAMFRYNDNENLWDELSSEPILHSFANLSTSVTIMFEHNGILYFNHSPQSALWKGYRLLEDFTLEQYGSTFYFSLNEGVFWKYQFHGELNNFFNQKQGLIDKNIIGSNYFVLDGTVYFQGDSYDQYGKGTYKIREGLLDDLL